ncbi:MAG: DUF4388 domain-containing protein, partial [Terriglobales bacterium]
MSTAQKNVDKPFNLAWQTPGSPALFTLTVMVGSAAQRDNRRGWNQSAIDNSAIGDGEWKMSQEVDGKRTEVFALRTSDASLVIMMIDEANIAGVTGAAEAQQDPYAPPGASPFAAPVVEPMDVDPSSQGSAAAMRRAVPVQTAQEGNLRQTPVRSLLENFNSNKTTGRLMCDVGTLQVEVFFTAGEPVHAKSCHSIYQDRDATGDGVLVEFLTWKDGTYKFQEGWPAASKSITRPLQAFLDGQVDPNAPAAADGATTVEATDDFRNVDEIIGETYTKVIDPCGALQYGLFLMLARGEFVRFEVGRNPFCVAAIGL